MCKNIFLVPHRLCSLCADVGKHQIEKPNFGIYTTSTVQYMDGKRHVRLLFMYYLLVLFRRRLATESVACKRENCKDTLMIIGAATNLGYDLSALFYLLNKLCLVWVPSFLVLLKLQYMYFHEEGVY